VRVPTFDTCHGNAFAPLNYQFDKSTVTFYKELDVEECLPEFVRLSTELGYSYFTEICHFLN